MLCDPIADFLTRIRNASRARHVRVDAPLSNEKLEIARVLMENRFISHYEVFGNGPKRILRIKLRYDHEGHPVINNVKRVSKPGLRIYSGFAKLKKVLNGLGIAILSTNLGIMSDKQCRTNRVGGEILAYVW